MRIWTKTKEFSEGKFLVVRRDGTTPPWPHFVIAGHDPCATAALRAYAQEASRRGFDPEFIDSVFELAHDFEKLSATPKATAKSDPDAPPHRTDNPSVLAAMRGEPATIYVHRDVGVSKRPEFTIADANSLPDGAISFTPTLRQSSNVGEVGRNNQGDLFIKYLDGRIYRWEGIADHHHDALINAESPGSYIHRNMPKGKPFTE